MRPRSQQQRQEPREILFNAMSPRPIFQRRERKKRLLPITALPFAASETDTVSTASCSTSSAEVLTVASPPTKQQQQQHRVRMFGRVTVHTVDLHPRTCWYQKHDYQQFRARDHQLLEMALADSIDPVLLQFHSLRGLESMAMKRATVDQARQVVFDQQDQDVCEEEIATSYGVASQDSCERAQTRGAADYRVVQRLHVEQENAQPPKAEHELLSTTTPEIIRDPLEDMTNNMSIGSCSTGNFSSRDYGRRRKVQQRSTTPSISSSKASRQSRTSRHSQTTTSRQQRQRQRSQLYRSPRRQKRMELCFDNANSSHASERMEL